VRQYKNVAAHNVAVAPALDGSGILFRLISTTLREMGAVALVTYLIDKMHEHD